MKKYKLIGVSEFAERFLCLEYLEALKEMIGSTLTESDIKSNVDGKSMFIMPDGEDTHISFLELEEVEETKQPSIKAICENNLKK